MPTITMDDSHVTSIEHVKVFLKLGQEFQFRIPDKKGRYQWIEKTLRLFSYHRLKKKKERSIVRRYIRTVTGMSNGQLTRLIKKSKQTGMAIPNYSKNKKNGFHTIYGPKDIALLISADVVHHYLSGEATKQILKREFEIFHRNEYETIAKICSSYIYVIRSTNRQYNSSEAKFVHKTRARHSNDNALVESKNGSIIRKLWGRNHIPVKYAKMMNEFNHRYVNMYLNYHRPCGFAEDIVDSRGKIKKKYSSRTMPYEKLKSLPNAKQYLKEGITFEQLDTIAYACSDNQFAESMENARVELFKRMKKI